MDENLSDFDVDGRVGVGAELKVSDGGGDAGCGGRSLQVPGIAMPACRFRSPDG